MRIDQVVRPHVVLRDVLLSLGRGTRDLEPDLRGDALAEALRQARLGPLAPRPAWTLGEALVECRQREVQEHDKGQLVLKEVVQDVCGRIVAGEDLVHR